jgi:hypothetical protein
VGSETNPQSALFLEPDLVVDVAELISEPISN